jgi:phosphate transport system substrate-binding protein
MTVAAVCASFGGAFASAASAATLTGAGSTLVAPLESFWGNGWGGQTGNTVTYSAIGSGKGITAISGGQVDFGASDAPLNPTQAAGCANCIQIPWALSATGVGYNIAGVPNGKLRLTGTLLAEIYLGQITNWSNPAIKAVNPGVNLPNLTITPVFRSDGSGDTYAFTNYLRAVNSTWASRIGFGTSVSFPSPPGVGAAGNLGVTTTLQNTNGAIAYIAVSYLIAHGVNVAAIQNAAGKYEYPNLTNIEAAAKIVKSVPSSNAISIVDPPRKAKTAYPISTFTYVIVPTTASQGSLLQSFINYALTTGQHFGRSLDFAPMPNVVLTAAKNSVGSIH